MKKQIKEITLDYLLKQVELQEEKERNDKINKLPFIITSNINKYGVF